MKKRVLASIDRFDIKLPLLLVFIANILDAVLTIAWLDLGVATEANPIMANLLEFGYIWFLVGKIGAVTIASIFLFICAHKRSAKVVALIACFIYGYVLGIHAKGAYDLNLLTFF